MRIFFAYLFLIISLIILNFPNANAELFINSEALSKLEKIKKIKNKKEKRDKNGYIYVGQKGMFLYNGYGILKYPDGQIFIGYFHKGNLRDGDWIIEGTIRNEKYEYIDKHEVKRNSNGVPIVKRTNYRPLKDYELQYLKENVFLKNKISYENYLKLIGKEQEVAENIKKKKLENKKEFEEKKSENIQQVTINNKKYSKLNFKEHGPFYGIKEDGDFKRGIHIGEKGQDGGYSIWYGDFGKNGNYHKGYFKHIYEDGSILYQYNEYKLDKNKIPIQDENGTFVILDSYLISESSFELVKKYIRYDIEIPFSFYDFETETNNELIANNINQKLKRLDENNKINLTTDENYYALVIGNNRYEHLEKLDAAENDAKVIADILQNKYSFEVNLLLNADYDTTVNSLFKITKKLKENDNLLIYYAGHGELDKAENRGYWLPVDANYEMRSKWVSNQRIVDRIKATKAKHVLLIADSCFSGTLMRSGSNINTKETIDQKYIERLKKKKTRLVITSGGNEPVVDSVGGNHSLFALKLIDTLKNNNSVINSQILFENIRRYVVANADQTPERAMVHKTGHDGGDFLFFPS